MADSILRLKVESQEYDNKLKQATNGLTRYVDECRKVGGTLEVVEKETLDYVRALGQMDTTSRTATGKLAEMKKTFVELSAQYKQMTEAEKQSPFGKALSQSLDQLKGRIQDSKSQLDDINKSINGGGGISGALDNLAGKFGMNVQSLASWGTALTAGKVALDVARDAFFKNEEQLDTWGRVVESSKSIYSGFLDALNTGDISGFLNRIDEITRAAQNAYNALDALNTFNAFNQVNVERTRTGMTESIADYRSGSGTKEQVKAAGEAYQKELRERQKLEKAAYIDAIKKVAAERGVNGQDLITALSGSYGSYESLKAIPMSGSRTKFTPGGMFGGSTAYEEAYPVNRQEQLGAALRKLNDTELQSLQALGAQAERTGNEIAQVDKQLTRVLNGKTPRISNGTVNRGSGVVSKTTPTFAADSIAAQAKLVSDLQKQWNEAGEDMRNGYLYQLIQAENKLKEMKDEQQGVRNQESARASMKPIMDTMGTNLSDTLGISATIEQIQAEFDKNPIVIRVDTNNIAINGKEAADSWKAAAGAISSVGGALQSIEDPAGKIAGIVAQAIATVAQAYAQALSTDWSTKSNIWAFIGAAAASTASMITTISAIHSATGYAQGGEVKGNSYSGDNIPIMANAGEVVLTRAMQSNLAGQLQNGGNRIQVVGRLSGEQLFLCAERWSKRTGKGEFVTWR